MKDYSCSFVDVDVATEDKYKEVKVELPKKKQKNWKTWQKKVLGWSVG